MKMAKMKKKDISANVGEEDQQVGLSFTAGESVNGSLRKTISSF